MTTRVTSTGPGTGVIPTDIAPRVTPPRARPFRAVVDASASAVVEGAQAAARRLPGGPIIAAALRPTGSASEGLTRTSTAALSAPTSSPEGSTGTGTPAGGDEPGIERALGENSDRTLYYLELQERINGENQYYTALSNVLKAEHEMVKVAIGNIR